MVTSYVACVDLIAHGLEIAQCPVADVCVSTALGRYPLGPQSGALSQIADRVTFRTCVPFACITNTSALPSPVLRAKVIHFPSGENDEEACWTVPPRACVSCRSPVPSGRIV